MPQQAAPVGEPVFMTQAASAARSHRGDDPTAPVHIVVATAVEAAELRNALARSGDPVLHVGVEVDTVLHWAVATQGLQLPTRTDEFAMVQSAIEHGYFATLAGMAGVIEPLIDTVRVWDAALPATRAGLVESATYRVDRERLASVAALHEAITEQVHAAGMVMPSQACAMVPNVDAQTLWIDAQVTSLLPIESAWLRNLQDLLGDSRRYARIDPAALAMADSPVRSDAQATPSGVTSAVDPLDEAGVAARMVSAALEAGVAARDIAVVVPAAMASRYRYLIGAELERADIPHDAHASGAGRFGSTRLGRALAAFLDSAAQLRHPRDVRFDHIRRIVREAGLNTAAGEVVTARNLRHLWRDLAGSDPAGWSDSWPVTEPEDAAAAVACQRVAAALAKAQAGVHSAQPWPTYAAGVRLLLEADIAGGPAVPAAGPDGAAALLVINQLLEAWDARNSSARWVQAAEELSRVLESALASNTGGVRLVDFRAAWATHRGTSIVVGMSDDIEPGVQSGIGPLSAAEVLTLGQDPHGGALASQDGSRSLQALLASTGSLQVTYPRSDQLRTIVRQPTRFLAPFLSESPEPGTFPPERVVEPIATVALDSIAAQFALVDAGQLGLLGPSDAAASLLRRGATATDVDSLLGIDLAKATECSESRRRPPPAGAVDLYNGDLRGLPDPVRECLSPDFRATGDASASPSRLESLLGCPIDWWAQRVMGIESAEDWDPRELDPRARGKWVHSALVGLSESRHLLDPAMTTADVHAALWESLGGPVQGLLHREHAEPELLGARFRVGQADVIRAASDIERIAARLRQFLANRGGIVEPPVHEVHLPICGLPLSTGTLHISGRVDRIDAVANNHYIVTDYKTGATGSGFQMAVYAWLWLAAHPGTAELLYATPSPRDYEAVHLGDETNPAVVDRPYLERFLVEALADSVATARSGEFPSLAHTRDHSRYCQVCADVVQDDGSRSSSTRGDRARALVRTTTTMEA